MKDESVSSERRSSPPTMEDVAKEAGVHRTTVSLALRNHPRIPKKTRERVKKIAERLGYRVNPLVSALMTSRGRRESISWKGVLGIITTGKYKEEWIRSNAYKLMYEGVKERSSELGYGLDQFWISDPQISQDRFNKMIRARNIPGLIIFPLPTSNSEFREMDWSLVSTVAIGHSIRSPEFHRVTNDYFHSMVTAVDKMLEKGYRRIAYVSNKGTEEKVDYLWLSAFLMRQNVMPEIEKIEPLDWEFKEEESKVQQWIQKNRPEVIISLPGNNILKRYPHLFAESSVQHVSLGIYGGDLDSKGGALGIYQDYKKIGATAVDFLVSMIYRGERGIPEQSQVLQIKGLWREDKS